jgi:hypothetical protein
MINYVTNSQSPSDYIEYLSVPDLSLQKKYSCIESLRVALTNNSLEWIQVKFDRLVRFENKNIFIL